jgi:hypothetical protein
MHEAKHGLPGLLGAGYLSGIAAPAADRGQRRKPSPPEWSPCKCPDHADALGCRSSIQSVVTVAGNAAVRKIKEWQATMDHLRSLPVKSPGELSTIPADERGKSRRSKRADRLWK